MIMTPSKPLRLTAVVLTGLAGLTSFAYADAFSDRLRTDPTAIPRPPVSRQMLSEPVYTESLRAPAGTVVLPQTFSYDSFYWNTIYACSPEYNPLFIENQKKDNGDGHSDQNIP
jgi:hypothetical protein